MAEKMKPVISVSRRTDIPAFYYDWLQTSLKNGSVEVPNPRFLKNTYVVDLQPENVHSLVLWSKDFRRVAKEPGLLANYNLYFQYTINNYARLFEPGVPPYAETRKILGEMLRKYRPAQFNIRFDPVIISNAGERSPVPEKPGLARLRCFENLCRDLRSLGMQGCRISTSYIALYRHVKRRLAGAQIHFYHLEEDALLLFFAKMAEIADQYGFPLACCSSPLLQQVPALQKGSCIDGPLLESLFGGRVSKAKDCGQRRDCGCTKSLDIGSYRQKCGFGCLYCYTAAIAR